MKGDYLMEHNKYVNAIRIYQKALGVRLSEQEEKQLGSQFAGEIYHNMGCAYVRLFQMEEAEACFEKAYGYLHTMTVIRSLLCALYMEKGQEAFEKRAEDWAFRRRRRSSFWIRSAGKSSSCMRLPKAGRYGRPWKKKRRASRKSTENDGRDPKAAGRRISPQHRILIKKS